MIVNKKQLSEIVGVSERTLTEWQQKGMPVRLSSSRGHANEYETADVIQWRVNYMVNGEKTETARERKERLQGNLLELQLAREAGLFLLRDEVEAALASAIVSARSEFMTSARKMQGRIKKEYDIDVPIEFFSRFVESTLARLSEHAPQFGDDDAGDVVELEAAANA